ncbi:MAG: polymer-forming cytoskeletal protein [Myxococcota bacterium]
MSETPPCVIGSGASFEGKVSFSGDARIEGHARGEIVGAGTLWIGEAGRVEATLRVARLVVHGQLRGRIEAKDAVELGPTARVTGELRTAKLRIAEGAHVTARIEMGEG